MVFALFSIICVGLLGASLFTTGIIFSITPLVAAGIALLVLSIFSMLFYYVYCQQPNIQSHSQLQGAAAYTTNNMNTMKRNKSDTDLELINRESQGV
jgi:hypothetical protein